jgi:uncharacterized protein (DUF486 family)
MLALLAQLPIPVHTVGLLVLSNVFMSLYVGQPLKLDFLWAGL